MVASKCNNIGLRRLSFGVRGMVMRGSDR